MEGAANTLTGILSAYLDSIPVLVISGNESSFHCQNYSELRAYGVQGFDSVTVLDRVTKKSLRVLDAANVLQDFSAVWNEAKSDRKGPVLLDFPMDLQRKLLTASEVHDAPSTLGSSNANEISEALGSEIESLSAALEVAERPLLYIGNGCRNPETLALVSHLIETLGAPFCLSWSAIDLFPSDHPQNVGRIGIYGDRASNIVLQKADLVLCIGTRLAIPQIGYDKADFGRHATKWVVEIDPTECSKFAETDWHLLNLDAKTFLQAIKDREFANSRERVTSWRKEIVTIWEELPRINQVGTLSWPDHRAVHSAQVMEYLNTSLDEDAVICTDVGAGLLTGHYMLEPRKGQRLFTSQGLGEMGFGLPGAIGAHFGAPKRQLVCLDTDGGIMFNLQELQLVSQHSINMKLFIFNNDGYTMIKISQENLFGARLAGSGIESGVSFPNFQKIAETFNLKYVRIDSVEDFQTKLLPVLHDSSGTLIEIVMSPNQKYLPRLATTKLEDGTLVSPPLEDIDPLLSIEDLERYLGYPAHPNSYKARGLKNEFA
ncbi:MAG: thiamine pyrophosphate-binding protein [Actinomycetota bacterium]